MPRDPQELLFVGIKDAVIALRHTDGTEVWRAQLKGADFVTIHWDGEALFAANKGEVFRLDPASGAILWNNPLTGLRTGVVSLASFRVETLSTQYETIAAQKRREAASQAAGASGAAGA